MKVVFENISGASPLTSFDQTNKLRFILNHAKSQRIELADVVLFTGLVNAHDHLEFNLFPCLVDKVYTNYKEWGADIHDRFNNEIKEVLAIPAVQRIKWGILKNLLCGVTSVVHHGKHHKEIQNLGYPVYMNYQYLHALDTEPFWKLKLMSPVKKDIMLHIGEGVSDAETREIDNFLRWNLFDRGVIGIHGIAMTSEQSKKFKAVIWCPDSNLRLYGKTADIRAIKQHTRVLIGTDSALSASSNIWDHLRLIRDLNYFTDLEIIESLVKQPSAVFPGINQGAIVVARKKSADTWNAFFSLDPEDILLVAINGTPLLIDEDLVSGTIEEYKPIRVGGRLKFLPKQWALVVEELVAAGTQLPLQVSSVTT